MPRKKKAPTASQRVAEHRARVIAHGGRQVTVQLRAEAVAKLEAWQARGSTITEAINRLLIRSKP